MGSWGGPTTSSLDCIPSCFTTAVPLPPRSLLQPHHGLQVRQDLHLHLPGRSGAQALREGLHPVEAGGRAAVAGGRSEQSALQDRHTAGGLPRGLLRHHLRLLRPREYPCPHADDEELLEKQRTLFELNALINKKLEINRQYYRDIKFLFIGDEEIYKIIQVGNTQVEFYPKERERKSASLVYIMNRTDAEEKLLTATAFRADLKSMLNVISKHKARTFAESMQF
jgi:hypothetical protein